MINEYLIQLADKLDTEGKVEAASAVDNIIRTGSLQKVAQYVGIIGYALRQNRAMGNCIRKKRVASNRPMQEVVLECLSEYQDGNSYQDTEWASKYASAITQKPELFDSAHISLLAQISESNDMPTHVANVKELCSVLSKHAAQDDKIQQVLTDFQLLGNLIQKEVGENAHLPFKVAAPPSNRSWWSRLWNPSESSWRDTTRGRNEDARIEMDNILENLMEITYVTQQMRLQVSQLKHQLLTSNPNQPMDPELQQMVASLDPDNWKNIQSILTQIESKIGQLPYESANYIKNIHQKMSDVYQRLNSIQQLMKNLRQRDAVIGWENDQFGSATEEFEALDSVLQRLYVDPLNEEYLYYARRMHSRLDERLKGKQVDTGVREWYIMLRNRRDAQHPQGWSHNEIVQEIARQMGSTPQEVDQLLAKNFQVFPGMNVTTGPEEESGDLGDAGEAGLDLGPDPAFEQEEPDDFNAPEQQLTEEDLARVGRLTDYLLKDDDITPPGTREQKAVHLRRLLQYFSEIIDPNNKIWQEMDKLLQGASIGSGAGQPLDTGMPGTAEDQFAQEELPDEQIAQPDVEEEVDSNFMIVLEEAKRATRGKIDSEASLKSWLESLAPDLLDHFIDGVDHYTNGLGDTEEIVRSIMDPNIYQQKRTNNIKPYDRINAVIAQSVKAAIPSAPDLNKDTLRDYLQSLNYEQMRTVAATADQLARKEGIENIEHYIDMLFKPKETGDVAINPEMKGYEDFGREIPPENAMLKQQNLLTCLVKIADAFDKVDTNIADLIDKYIEEHADDGWPDFPEFSPLVREK